MDERQSITLSLPRSLLRKAKRIAADRDTSMSALMVEALTNLPDQGARYQAARMRSLAAMRNAKPLGTQGKASWTRDELHER